MPCPHQGRNAARINSGALAKPLLGSLNIVVTNGLCFFLSCGL